MTLSFSLYALHKLVGELFLGLQGSLRGIIGRREKTPTPKEKIQHLDFSKDPRPLHYKTPPCEFYHENVRTKAVFRSLVRTKLALSNTGRFLTKAEILGVVVFSPFQLRVFDGNSAGFANIFLLTTKQTVGLPQLGV